MDEQVLGVPALAEGGLVGAEGDEEVGERRAFGFGQVHTATLLVDANEPGASDPQLVMSLPANLAHAAVRNIAVYTAALISPGTI